MLAIVKINGNQYKIEKNQTIFVPNLNLNVGDKVEYKDIILFEENGNIQITNISKAIKAEVVSNIQDDKIIAFKMKRRKGFRKKKGHRNQLTKLKIIDII